MSADDWVSNEELKHFGILRKSGRYPWGSGKSPYQRSMTFYSMVNDLKAQGIPPAEIATAMGLESIADLRSTTSIAKEEKLRYETNMAVTMRDAGASIQAISDELGIPAPTVRLRLKNSENIKESSLRNTANTIREQVDEHGIVDIGKGVEVHLGVADTKMSAAIAVLRDEGYETHNVQTRQPGTKQFTTQQVIVPEGVTFGEASKMANAGLIHTMGTWTENEGKTFFGIHDPINIDPKRIKVLYSDEHGADRDGTIFIRPGVDDLSMGKNNYAQVRIGVNGTHYLKGMAIINNDMPDGYDVVFNTNKKRGTPMIGPDNNTVLKLQTGDPDNPFGAMIKRQIVGVDPKTGKEVATSAVNILNEPGDWEDWRKSIPSQVLAKQPHSLIKSQLKVTRDQTADRMKEIDSITNPVVRKKAYEDFADEIDSNAVELRAAAMPRQKTQVLIPIPQMRKNEVYAPQFETGEPLVLIRFPHGGRFEIPEVIVNNNSRTAKKLLGNAPDAIGIHPSVAERLSGADFDGDTVLAIPNHSGKIKGSQSMGKSAKIYEDGLKNFEPKRKYGGYDPEGGGVDKKGRPKPNFELMTNTGMEMGMVTNLITDMQAQGAKPEHVVRAVRHSMVVIDAEKHQLDYKQSAINEGIPQLRMEYQGKKSGGASTLLSRATGDVYINERKERSAKRGGRIDKDTGELMWEETGKKNSAFDKKTGTYDPTKKVLVQEKVKRLSITKDAYDLVRDPSDPVESLYADHANEMKRVANAARLKSIRTPTPKKNPQAAAVYKDEVSDLDAQLKAAIKQKPLDRRAQNIANGVIKAKRQEDPTLRYDQDRAKKVERQASDAARSRLGLEKPVIHMTDRQWDAVQANAISPSKLKDILNYVPKKRVMELAMPKKNAVMTSSITARAKAMFSAGATTAEVAAALGVAPSTLRAASARGEV